MVVSVTRDERGSRAVDGAHRDRVRRRPERRVDDERFEGLEEPGEPGPAEDPDHAAEVDEPDEPEEPDDPEDDDDESLFDSLDSFDPPSEEDVELSFAPPPSEDEDDDVEDPLRESVL
jgi:hypothetical protein